MTSLPVVYDGVQQPELDIVSIPGLPDLVPHYKVKDHSQWLREVLSHQIPKARIMAFQYDFAKAPSVDSWRSLLDHVASLLWSLVHRREGAEKRPILFVCYSFGAFILKKALLIAKENNTFRSILECTRGIVFLGCLHDDSHPKLQDICLKCAAVEFGTAKKHDVVEALRKADGWNIIKEVMESFKTLPAPFEVRGFFERRPTVLPGTRFSVVKKSEYLCPEPLSSLGWDNEKLIGVNVDHSQLSTYPHRGDEEFFPAFMKTLSELVEQACPPSIIPDFARIDDPTDLPEGWTDLRDMTASTSSLSIESEPSMPRNPRDFTAASGTRPLPEPSIPCYVTKPYEENPDFIGRDDVLKDIHSALAQSNDGLKKQRTFALTGLGGLGKTQIAIRYAFSHRDIYHVVLWAHADGQAKLAESFCLFATELGLCDSETVTPSIAKQVVKDCLKNLDTNWLVIFDNADGSDNDILLKEFWPAGDRGSILITSRDTTLSNQFEGLELSVLDEASAVTLLLNLTRFDRKRFSEQTIHEEMAAASEIVKRIDYLPLGIYQASNLIISDSSYLSDFLEAYGNRELIEDSEEVRLVNHGSTYKYSLRTVWNMNFERLTNDPQSLIKLMSFLDPDRIQMRLLNEGAQKAGDSALSFLDTPYKRNKCKSALLKSALVMQSEKLRELRMHRLVQASCLLRMDIQEQRRSFKNAVTLVKHCWPVPLRIAIHNPSLWEDQQAFLPHVQAICAHYAKSCERDEPLIPHNTVDWEFASVLYEAGWYCYERGLLDSVNEILLPAEQYCLQHVDEGGGYRILADIYGGLGSLHTESNQFQAAYDSFSKQWKYLELAFENSELERPSIWEVFGLGRLGNGLHGLHRYQEAEKYYRKCLKEWEKLPGDRKIFTTHLGTCLWLQGRPDEAEEVLTSIIKDRNDITNFRTGQALFALGNVQISQATKLTGDGEKDEARLKFAEAMETHKQATELYSITLGPRHHKTADAFHKVGWHLHRQNDYAAALNMFDKALDVYTSSPHLFKNEIARTRYKVGCLYQDMGDSAKGRKEIKIAEKMRQEIVPAENWAPAKGEEDFDEIVQFWTR